MSKKQLSKDEVTHIAKLAKLPLQSNEVEKFQAQLTETLDYIGRLSKLKTEKIKPTSNTTGLKSIFKEDKLRKSLSQGETLSGTNSTVHGMFKIGVILQKE